ncbi:MAG: DMT family transporter [Bryobacterales bacterium]
MDWPGALSALAVGVARGGNQVAIKLTLFALAPFGSALARMALSSFTVWLWSRTRGLSLTPSAEERKPLLLLGLLFSVQIAMLHWGADMTSPAYAVTIVNTNPIWANLISPFFVAEDRLTLRRAVGLLLAFTGVAGVVLGRPELEIATNPRLGNWIILASAALVGARTVYIQRIVQRMSPEKAVLWQMGISLPLFGLGSLFFDDWGSRGPVDWRAAAAIGYQGIVVGGLALVAWVALLRRHTPGSVSVFSFATPIAGVLLSAWLFREPLAPRLLFGLAAVLAGIALASRTAARKVFETATNADKAGKSGRP